MADSDPTPSNLDQPDAAPPAPASPIDSGPPVPATPPRDPMTTVNAPALPPAPVVRDVPAPPASVDAPLPPVKQNRLPIQKTAPASRDALSKFRNKNVEEDGSPMSFIDHLMELRKRLWLCIIVCLLSIVGAIVFYEQIYAVLTGPINSINVDLAGPDGDKYRASGALEVGKPAILLSTTGPLSNMMLVLWMGFWGGIVIASPLVLYQVWAFIAPGLKATEKKAIMPVLYGGLVFFLGGLLICYKWMIPPSLKFFVTLDLSLKNKINWTSDTTIDLMLWMMIISGLLCEIPLIVAALAKMDVIRGSTLIRHWRGMTFGAILIGATVSPGNDLASMGVFAGLMLGIYLVSIMMAYMFQQKPPKKKDKKKDDDKKP